MPAAHRADPALTGSSAARISSTANPAVKAARRIARRPPRGTRELLVEGPQAVGEAGAHLRRLFVTDAATQRHAGLLARVRRDGVDVLVCTDAVVAAIGETVHTQGLVGVATLPATSLEAVLPTATLLIVLVDVRDPGNLGAIVRTADAAGADAVVLVGECVDPRNPKVVRASAGSVFHLPVVDRVTLRALADGCARHGISLVAAAGDGQLTHTEVDLSARCALVFGNEAHGLDDEARVACDQVVAVPIAAPERPGYIGAAESLNLAATVAVMAFEAARQRSQDDAAHGSRQRAGEGGPPARRPAGRTAGDR